MNSTDENKFVCYIGGIDPFEKHTRKGTEDLADTVCQIFTELVALCFPDIGEERFGNKAHLNEENANSNG